MFSDSEGFCGFLKDAETKVLFILCDFLALVSLRSFGLTQSRGDEEDYEMTPAIFTHVRVTDIDHRKRQNQ